MFVLSATNIDTFCYRYQKHFNRSGK